MPAWEHVVAVGLGSPGVFESTSYGTSALKAKKQGGLMCRLRTDPDALVMRVRDVGEREALLQNGGPAFFTTPHYDGYPYVLIDLDRVDPVELAELVEDAWACRLRSGPSRTTTTEVDLTLGALERGQAVQETAPP